MKAKTTDLNKVQEALDAGQGRATARILDTLDITALAAYGERRLEELGLPKKFRAGAKAFHTPPRVANSYKYAADGSYCTLTRGSSSWYVTDVHRGQCGNQSYGGSSHRSIKLSPEQQIRLVNASALYSDIFAVPQAAIDNKLRWQVEADPKLLATLQVVQKSAAQIQEKSLTHAEFIKEIEESRQNRAPQPEAWS